MRIGVPKEVKNHEYRVGLTPHSVAELAGRGHPVLVQQGAGAEIGFLDEHYQAAGARLVANAQVLFAESDLIVKVKEPQASERALLHAGHTLFTYLHLAPDQAQTTELLASGACCLAYETVTDAQGRLPLLAPMSEVAGRMAVQAGAHCLEIAQGGRGVLLGGAPGVDRGRVLILGGGVVGGHAAQMAIGLGAHVTIMDKNIDALRRLDERFANRVQTLYASGQAVAEQALKADLLIGCVLIPGAAAPRLITRGMVANMRPGSVIVDVAIDQGGCVETSHATTHTAPTFVVDGVVHYCVANMPGAVARTSTLALNNATLPFVLALADRGVATALKEDPYLRAGLNIAQGAVCCESVARAHGLAYTPADTLVARL